MRTTREGPPGVRVVTGRSPVGPAVVGMVLALLLTACGFGGADGPDVAGDPAAAGDASAAPADGGHAEDGHADDGHAEDGHAEDGHAHDGGTAVLPPRPLRPGERRLDLAMPEAYTPSPPTPGGTDDYRCFLLDPDLTEDTWLTGTTVRPGTPGVVHHVILFRVPPDQVSSAELKDDATNGQGWPCFGGSGLAGSAEIDDAPWLGAWAPGGEESVHAKGLGVRLAAGSRIVMQVHYNLLAGSEPDVTTARLRTAPGQRDLTPLHTVLLPAPVELPCRPEHDDGPLCDREAAAADVQQRFGQSTGDLLHLLCGTQPRPSQRTRCDRVMVQPATIRAVAGHMHLLGREIEVVANPGTPRERTLLDIDVWDFDDQGARRVRPVRLRAFDTVRVTCRHVQWLRDELPAFEGQPDRYVLWGEGTTDEMCLGTLLVTRP